ncbi:MAG: lysylphosphatidylglycerol synthase transmembrane domain-containing protein [Bacteroidia bacterium]|nr:lysylphosphatidylglycerol synthase transmembrane domain-containing protein [Bacteroidia bacterium]
MNSKRIQDILKIVLSLALGVAIIWLLYRKTSLKEIWEIAKTAHLGIIALSLFFGLLGNYLRALRWELFLNSLGYNPKRESIVFATFGNYAVNYLLPRAGDIWRCGIVAKYDQIPFSKTFETFFVDKILDILAGVALIVISLILYVDFFISYFHQNPGFAENLTKIFTTVWLYLLLAVIAGVVFVMFTYFRENPIVKKINNFFQLLKYDMALIAKMKSKRRIIIYTIFSWLSFYLYFYICFYAFDFTKELGFVIGWIVFAMSNLGVAVPVQGGIGTWHFMVISSLVIFGVGYDQAGAFAGAVFTIQSVWIILLGVIGILLLPHVKRGKENLGLQKPAEQEETTNNN